MGLIWPIYKLFRFFQFSLQVSNSESFSLYTVSLFKFSSRLRITHSTTLALVVCTLSPVVILMSTLAALLDTATVLTPGCHGSLKPTLIVLVQFLRASLGPLHFLLQLFVGKGNALLAFFQHILNNSPKLHSFLKHGFHHLSRLNNLSLSTSYLIV